MRVLPLYGVGFERLGQKGRAIEVPTPQPGPGELLVRHDAVGLCYSDYKVIRAGSEHPLIHHDLQSRPVVLGHEVALTVVGVGRNSADHYRLGDRFTIHPDIYVDNVLCPYGYGIPGGLSQFNVLDRRLLSGEAQYLLPLEPTTGYAQAALTEPWACVEAAYGLSYRTSWRKGGRVLVTGPGNATGWDDWRPGRVTLSGVSDSLGEQLRSWARGEGIELSDDDGDSCFDDILVLSSDADVIEHALKHLANGGILSIVSPQRAKRPVKIDLGRIHYDHITVVGSVGPDIRSAYRRIRSSPMENGSMWVLGASGPTGQMHVERALRTTRGPRVIAATNLRSARIRDLPRRFGGQAEEARVSLVCLTEQQSGTEAFEEQLWAATNGRGFDDIIVIAPSATAASRAASFLAPGGVLNLFAGVPPGTVDVDTIVRRGARLIGSTGSSTADMRHVLDLVQSGQISTNHLVSAIGSLDAATDGLRAVADGRFSGRVVIYPQIEPMPLTSLPELKQSRPAVYDRLLDGSSWSTEAETELLSRASRS